LKKQQSFYVLKISSTRIRESNYNIKLSLSQARKNGEVVSIAENQVIKSLFSIQNRKYDSDEIKELFINKRKIKNKKSSVENSEKLKKIEKRINEILYIPELVSVYMDNKKHYSNIINNSFFINNKKYVRLLCGAGHARRNTVIFISEEYEKTLKDVLNNGRKEMKMIPAKNNAYFALAYSGTSTVRQPYFCVVPDCEIKRIEKVDFINDDNEVIETEKELDFNLFDGQGLISPRLAQWWAEDLELDYLPSTFIIRNSFLKGMVCTFDFHRFSDECGVHIVKDVWGNDVNIRDMDLVITASQFKMWNAYNNIDEYIQNCKKNNMTFGVTRCSPKTENDYVFTNYQFVQVLNLNDQQVENLCQKTIDFFDGSITSNINYTLLYLLGKMSTDNFDPDMFSKINDPVTKSLILNNNLLHDPYVQSHLIHSLNRKIRDSYIGNLLVDGNYTMVVFDPYAFCEHLFGFEVKGLLKRNEHYCSYWNHKDVDTVAAMRAPLTWRSEVNVLNLKKEPEMRDWYEYLGTGAVIYNVHGADAMIHSDCDADGDIVMLTNQKEFIDGAYGGLPITYEKKKAVKTDVVESELYKVDLLSFDSRIGYITNCSTTMYAMEKLYDDNSSEKKEIINRLKICRRLQGDQIDLTKGIEINPFPSHWVRWNKDGTDFDNSLIIDKRPYFMRWLYPEYNKNYLKYISNFDFYCLANFGFGLNELLNKTELNEKETETISKYYRFNPLLDTDCIMNKVCHLMERKVKEIKSDKRKQNKELVSILKDNDIPFDREKQKLLDALYRKYKNEKRNFANFTDEEGESKFKSIEQYNKHIRDLAFEISSNIQELTNLAVSICYELHPSDNKNFVWAVFGDGVVENVKKNKQEKVLVPTVSFEEDSFSYLGKTFKMVEINTEEKDNYEFDF